MGRLRVGAKRCQRCGGLARMKWCEGCAAEVRVEKTRGYSRKHRRPWSQMSDLAKLRSKERSLRASIERTKERLRWEDDGGAIRYEWGPRAEAHGLQKRCSRCGELRPIGWYHRREDSRRGEGRLQSACRDCARPGTAARQGLRRARIKGAGYEVIHAREIDGIGERQGWRCGHCGKPIRHQYEVDHIRPLSKGGIHAIRNLQLLCGPCNRSKSAKWGGG